MKVNEQTFSKDIYQTGLNYYNRARVSRIHLQQRQGFCQVRGSQIQHVSFVIDDQAHIIQMSCDCQKPYCEHAAAVYVKYMNELKASSISIDFPSLLHVYHSFQEEENHFLSQQQFVLFIEKMKEILELVVRNANPHNREEIMSHIKVMIDDYSHMHLTSQQKKSADGVWFIWFRKLFRQQTTYRISYCQWIEDLFFNQEKDELFSFFLQINQDLPDYCLFPLYSKLLTYSSIQCNNKYVQPFSLYIIQHYKTHKKDIEALKNKLPESSIVSLYDQMSCALEKKDYAQALVFYQKLRYLDLSDEIIHEMIDIENTLYFHNDSVEKYKTYILQCYDQKEHQENIDYLKCLKEKYGELWDQDKYMIYDALQRKLNVATFRLFIHEMDEWQWPLYVLLKVPSFKMFLEYEQLIRKHDLENYFVVFLSCLMNEIQYLSGSQDYQMVPFHIDQQRLYGISWTTLREMIDEIKKTYKKRTALINVLDEYLERCDRIERVEYENLCRKSSHYTALSQI